MPIGTIFILNHSGKNHFESSRRNLKIISLLVSKGGLNEPIKNVKCVMWSVKFFALLFNGKKTLIFITDLSETNDSGFVWTLCPGIHIDSRVIGTIEQLVTVQLRFHLIYITSDDNGTRARFRAVFLKERKEGPQAKLIIRSSRDTASQQ